MIQFLCAKFSLIIIPVPDRCANPFCNKIFSVYIFHSIINDGMYLLGECFFLWENLCIGRVINYHYRPVRAKSNFFWAFHSWSEWLAYPILWNCAEDKGYILGVSLGRPIYWLPNGFTLIYIILPGYGFFYWKVSCCHP